MLPHPPPAAAGRRPSLDGLERVYGAPPVARAWSWWVVEVFLPVAVAGLLFLVFSVWLPGSRSFAALAVAPVFVNVVTATVQRRSSTTLRDDGVLVRNGLTRGRLHRWENVTTVVVEGRFADRSALRMRDWGEVALPHVPAEVAQRLLEQIDPAAARPARRAWEGATPALANDSASRRSPTAGGPRPDDDLDLEGPFRRGPRRR